MAEIYAKQTGARRRDARGDERRDVDDAQRRSTGFTDEVVPRRRPTAGRRGEGRPSSPLVAAALTTEQRVRLARQARASKSSLPGPARAPARPAAAPHPVATNARRKTMHHEEQV
jgi:hypothetical protein